MKVNLKKFFAVLSIFTMTAVDFTGCGSDNEKQDATNNLRVGTAFDSGSFAFGDSEKNEFQGFEMELIRAIGRELGRPVQISNINFEGLIQLLKSDHVDVIIAGLTITDARKEIVSFSDPYYKSGLTAVVRADESEINSVEDLAGKKIGVKIESSSLDFAKTIPNAEIHEYDLANDTFTALKNGEVDAAINDKPLNDHAIASNQVTEVRIILPGILVEEDYGIAVRKDDVQLLQQINDALKKLHESGEYARIYSKWFETPEEDQQQFSYTSLRNEISQ